MWLLIMLPFLFGVLNDLLGLPWAIRYLLDGAWLVLLYFLVRYQCVGCIGGMKAIVLWSVVFVAYTFVVYLAQFQSPLYYLWGVRNNFRFPVAFFAFAAFLKQEDVAHYFRILEKLFWIHIAVSIIQFFGFGIKQDFLGGIFGSGVGVNGYVNMFFVIIVIKSIIFYLEKVETSGQCFTKCAAALAVAAMAEMKFFYVEFIVIMGLSVLFTNFTWRKVWIMAGGLTAVLVGAYVLAIIFPEYEGFLSIEYLLKTATSSKGYTSSGDLNRLNAISRISELWLTNWGQQLFGLGLGNCDTSGFSFVNTPFYEMYSDMHYTWRSYAMMYLENGYIGLVFYYGFFVLIYRAARRMEKHGMGLCVTYCRICRVLAICCIIMSIYNAALRTEAAYMAYFILAIPFILNKHSGNTRKECEA